MDEKKFPEPLEALLLVLVVFSGILLATITIGVVVKSIGGGENLDRNLELLLFFMESLFLIVPWYYARRRGFDLQALFRFGPVEGRVYLYAFVMGLALIILTDEMERLITLFMPMPDTLADMMKPLYVNTPLEWLIVITGSVLIASVAEEGLFRGFLQVSLEKKGDVTRAVVLASVSWTIIHMNPYWAIQIFFMGIFLGYIAQQVNSIRPAILIHGMNNLLALLLINLRVEADIPYYTWSGHVSPPFLLAAAGMLYWSIRALGRLPRPRPTRPSL
ncbi:MAG TPA: CPBP family intramembrane metalloprotease [Caldithrix abyssi]|uniref:CPBP family intramembrane metalloprotease n=1 Tax=Caldithrix abyssi TaxID=187145 RepID=A0A7V5RNS5_CALAY|nr:CPBP family intramembrane metalloprotease [Caldithrix abyssi]